MGSFLITWVDWIYYAPNLVLEPCSTTLGRVGYLLSEEGKCSHCGQSLSTYPDNIEEVDNSTLDGGGGYIFDSPPLDLQSIESHQDKLLSQSSSVLTHYQIGIFWTRWVSSTSLMMFQAQPRLPSSSVSYLLVVWI